MSLTDEDRKSVVNLRIEKAQKAYLQAKVNLNLGFVEVSANRFYYAAYYAVSALLIAKELSAQTHSGIIAVFGREFVKTNIVTKDDGKLYSQLFTYRLKGDYDDNYNLDINEIKPLEIPVGLFISKISALAKSYIAD